MLLDELADIFTFMLHALLYRNADFEIIENVNTYYLGSTHPIVMGYKGRLVMLLY